MTILPSNNWTLSVKLFFTSTIMLSLATMLKTYVSTITNFGLSNILSTYTFLQTLLKPPYIYIIINAIIVLIVASSKLQEKADNNPPRVETMVSHVLPAVAVKAAEPVVYSSSVSGDANGYDGKTGVADHDKRKKNVGGDQALVDNTVKMKLHRQDCVEALFPDELKPPVSSRFAHRKAAKASTGGKALKVSKMKKHETLESTWKAITEGRSMPLTRHLNKSETFKERQSSTGDEEDDSRAPRMKKSETFNDRTDHVEKPLRNNSGSGKLRRERSISLEELNKRVEAFINKFNLQRQESSNQYFEMIGNGV